MVDPNKYKDSDDFIKKCYGDAESEEYREYKRKLTKYVEAYMDSKELVANEEKGVDIDIYLVFENPRYKRHLFEISKNECFSKNLYVEERKYSVSEPPYPDMILWENKHKWTCLRVCFIWIITLGICFCSYLLVGIAQYQKEKLNSNQSFGVDC